PLACGALRMRRNAWYALVLCLGSPALVSAQGFGIYEHNSCTMARGGVAAASPCPDGSAIFFNPAGLVGLSGTHLTAGLTLIRANGGFTDDVLVQQIGRASCRERGEAAAGSRLGEDKVVEIE